MCICDREAPTEDEMNHQFRKSQALTAEQLADSPEDAATRPKTEQEEFDAAMARGWRTVVTLLTTPPKETR